MKIGIFGGTFNPIHNGHMALANTAMEQLCLDKLIFVPTGCPYTKDLSLVLLNEKRYHMVEAAIKSIANYEVSDLELKRKGNSYTYDTLLEFQRLYKGHELYFLLGADCIFQIESWKNPQKIFSLCTLVTAVRDNVSFSKLHTFCNYLKSTYNAKITILNFKEIELSSTLLRENIKHERDVSNYIPKEALNYINENHLYH